MSALGVVLAACVMVAVLGLDSHLPGVRLVRALDRVMLLGQRVPPATLRWFVLSGGLAPCAGVAAGTLLGGAAVANLVSGGTWWRGPFTLVSRQLAPDWFAWSWLLPVVCFALVTVVVTCIDRRGGVVADRAARLSSAALVALCLPVLDTVIVGALAAAVIALAWILGPRVLVALGLAEDDSERG